MLAVEFLDELVFGARDAAWPIIRTDLELSYVQIGLLLSMPIVIGTLVEPAIGILGDVWRRRLLVIIGGVCFTASLVLISFSSNFYILLAALALFNPSSGVFVGLSQASLMDSAPLRHEQNMARWTFAGSVGVLLGPLALGLAVTLGMGWRGMFLALVAVSVVVLFLVSRIAIPKAASGGDDEPRTSFRQAAIAALQALRRRSVIRWLVLLEFSDLLLDVFNGYLALYMVDVAGVSPAQAALAVAVWAGAGLAGGLVVIPLLERVRGLTYLRHSVLASLVVFPAVLLLPDFGWKLVAIALLGFGNAGWYSVLKGQLYSVLPGQSASVLAIGSVSGLAASLIPLGLGAAATLWGLDTAMWLLLAGPVVLLVGVARDTRRGDIPNLG